MNHQEIGIIAGVIASLAFVPYVWSILKHETRPHRTTWFVFALTGWLTLVTYREVGAVASLVVALSYAIFSTLIFVLSIRLGKGGWSIFDIFCLTVSLIGILVWLWLDSAFFGLVCFLIADFAAILPTLRKTWLEPWEENRFAWLLSSLGALTNIFAIEIFTIEIAAYPFYMFCVNASVFLLTLQLKRHP